MPLSTIRSDNTVLSEKVAEQVIQYIQENRLRCGDRLPNERELEANMGVSRSTIREAMRSLRSRGIVEIRQGSGTYVAESMGVTSDPLGLAFRYDKNRTLADLLDLRFMFEPSIAAACAARATQQQRKEIRELTDAVADLIRRGEDHCECDIELHCAIARAADNELVNVMFPDILRGIHLYLQVLRDAMLEQTIRGHEEIATAIMNVDPQGAYEAMLRHLEDNRISIMDCLGSKDPKGYKDDRYRFERICSYARGKLPQNIEGGVFLDRY